MIRLPSKVEVNLYGIISDTILESLHHSIHAHLLHRDTYIDDLDKLIEQVHGDVMLSITETFDFEDYYKE